MNRVAKSAVAVVIAVPIVAGLSACNNDSDVASKNLSKAADSYKVYRQIVVYNAITDKYILEVRGFCSLGNNDSADEVSYTCKLGRNKFIKDIIEKSDNTLVYAHQLVGADVSTQRYKVIFKPSTIIPDVDAR